MGLILADATLQADAASLSLSGLSLGDIIAARLNIYGQVNAGAWDRAMIRFNDDAARNYLWAVENQDNTRADSDNVATYVAGIEAAHLSGPTPGVNYWAYDSLNLLLPGATDRYKHLLMRGGMVNGANALATVGVGFWKSLAPITKITLVPNAGGVTLKAGTRMQLESLAAGVSGLGLWTPPVPNDPFTYPNGAVPWPWQVTGTVSINGNALAFTNPDSPDANVIWNGYAFPADQFSQFRVAVVPAGGHWIGATVRCNKDAGNHYLGFIFNNTTQLYKKVGNTYTALGTSTAYTPSVGDIVRVEAQGTTLRLLVNGVQKNSLTDASITAAGQPGIAAFSNTAKADDFLAGAL